MLWDLEKVNYWVGFEKIGPSISSKNKREVAIKWDKFRKKVKNSPLWKNAEYIEIQCSTDSSFPYGGDGEVHKALSTTSKEKVLRKWMRPE